MHTNLPQDPNDKVGPLGYGPEKFVPVGVPLPFRINFENTADATAPAHRVRIVDQLPPTMDPRTVRLTEIGFKQYRIVIPPNRSFYQTRMQLAPDLDNLKVDISAGLNIATGAITWTLIAIDPATGEEPISPNLGILPPNNASNDGQGYVSFTVVPTANQATRTDLANTATIYFDDNEPITTNTTTNLLDADIPTSSIGPIPQTSATSAIPLSWSGSDVPNGSGLGNFDVYVSENNGEYFPYLSTTADLGGTFNGKYGRSYRFYSVARDNAGNVESAPSVPDAAVTILGGAYEGDVASRPNGNNDGTVDVQDVAQVRRFAAKLDTDFQYNEFQRADTSPVVDGGDGALSVADVMQASRFATGTDAVRESFGPMTAGSLTAKTANTAELLPRSVHPLTISRTANKVIIGVRLEAQGDETGIGFTLDFNTAHLANPANITLGPGAGGAVISSNITQAGKVGIIIDKLPNQPFAPGDALIATIEFDVVDFVAATTQITFSGDPVANQIVDGNASALTTDFPNTIISLVSPTAAGVTVGGRVTDAAGRPVPNTVIRIADDAGTIRTAISNGFGYYKFEDVEAGRTYVVSARHKAIQFARPSVIVTLDDALEGLDFVGLP